MKVSRIISILLAGLMMFPFMARASCYLTGGVTSELSGSINFGHVIVQHDLAVGSAIATATTGAYNGGDRIAGCNNPWNYRWEMTQWGTLSALGQHIYKTNVPGVGIRLTNMASGEVLPYEDSRGVVDVVITGDGIKAELIKTGDIAGGTLTPGVLARASASDSTSAPLYFANVALTGTNSIESASCELTPTSLRKEVILGDHSPKDFSGVGSTTDWVDFDISLICNPGARLSVTFMAGAEPSADSKGVMKLDPGGASGVGVQLYYQRTDKPVLFGISHFYQTAITPQNDIKLKARYYQTEQTITPGVANATATFTVMYK